MARPRERGDFAPQQSRAFGSTPDRDRDANIKIPQWKKLLSSKSTAPRRAASPAASMESGYQDIKSKPEKWSLGVLNDKETDEVPGGLLHQITSSTL